MGKSVKGKELGNAIYQRANGTYEARYIDRFGKQRSVYAKTLTEVGRKQREKIYENEKQINVINTNMTLDEWYEKWITTCKTHCRTTTKRTYEIQYNRIREKLGWRKLTSLNLIVLQDAFNELGSDKSRSDCKALLVDILNRAIEADLLIKNPALGINSIIDGKEKQKNAFFREKKSIFCLRIQRMECCILFSWLRSVPECAWGNCSASRGIASISKSVSLQLTRLLHISRAMVLQLSTSFINLKHRQEIERFR